jgi:hypothetical protein
MCVPFSELDAFDSENGGLTANSGFIAEAAFTVSVT